MYVNILVLFTVLFCTSLNSEAPFDATDDNALQEFERPTPRDVLSWKPEKVISKMKISGEDIYFRVKDGETAKAGQFPYQISFRKQVGNSHWFVTFCGGSLISQNAVLTAAHCFRDKKPCDSCCMTGIVDHDRLFHIYAVAGTQFGVSHFHGNNDTAEYGQWRTLKSGYFPKNFKFPDNDIAIIFTTKEYKYTELVSPIPMPSSFKEYNGKTCTLSGYGKSPEGERIKYLQFAELRVLNSKACNKIHSRKMMKYICSADETTAITKGDAGSPLVCKKTGDSNENETLGLLVGVAVTADKKEAKEGSLFTRVSAYSKLIQQKLARGDATRPRLCFTILSIPFTLVLRWFVNC